MSASAVGVGILIVQAMGLLIVIGRGFVKLENRLARIETFLSVCPHVEAGNLCITVPGAGVEERIRKLITEKG